MSEAPVSSSSTSGSSGSPVPSSGNSRRAGRVLAMQVLYAAEVGTRTVADVLPGVIESMEAPADQRAHCVLLVDLVLEHRAKLRGEIEPLLENWDWDRLALVDRLLLEVGLAELLFCPETPPKVVLAEYPAIGKKYSTEESALFLSGVLGALANHFKLLD